MRVIKQVTVPIFYAIMSNMPRIPRIVIPDVPHHITQRGNYRQRVFYSNDDYLSYLVYLKHYSEKYSLKILGYCLMPNHVHLIAVPSEKYSMARTVGLSHMRYSQSINWKRNNPGHLWQSRFFSCPLDDAHLVVAMRYVEMNPVKAKLCKDPWMYRWSSSAVHTGRIQRNKIIDSEYWLQYFSCDDWRVFLTDDVEPGVEASIRKHLKTGRPLGDNDFVSMVERRLGRSFEKGKKGRPAKRK